MRGGEEAVDEIAAWLDQSYLGLLDERVLRLTPPGTTPHGLWPL